MVRPVSVRVLVVRVLVVASAMGCQVLGEFEKIRRLIHDSDVSVGFFALAFLIRRGKQDSVTRQRST